MKTEFRATLVGIAALALLAGCSHTPKPSADMHGAPATASALAVLEAKITPTQGNTCQGTVRFEERKDGAIRVTADLSGLEPNTKHGFHVHETGDCSAPDAMSAGGHYNPTQHPHALPPAAERHAGDLGNVTSDASGNVHYVITVTNISLSSSGNSVLGRAVIVHAKPDDGGQPTGNAGARVGCGVIAAVTR